MEIDINNPLKRIANPENMQDKIEAIKYGLRSDSNQRVGQLDELSRVIGDTVAQTVNLQSEGNMSADLVNVDWWLPIGLSVADDVTTINRLVYDGSEYVYVGGNFNYIGGVKATNIARYSLISRNWEEVGNGVNATVHAIAIDSTGGVHIGGSFTTAGGDTNADALAKLSAGAWVAVVNFSGLTNVFELVFDSTGGLYVGGDFTNAGGSANADYIFKWDGSLTALSTGLGNIVNTIKIHPTDGNIYVGGQFSNAGGDADADFIAKWNGSAFSAVSTFALDDIVKDIEIDDAGNLYVCGDFSSAAGVTATGNLFKWDGTNVTALGNGVAAVTSVNKIAIDSENTIYVGGYFSDASGVDNTGDIAKFYDNQWYSVSNAGGVAPLSSPVLEILPLASGSVLVGGSFTTAGSVSCAGLAIVCHPLSEAIDILASLFELYNNQVVIERYGGWNISYLTLVYASASTFTIQETGDYTGVFTKDTRIKYSQPTLGTKYAVIVSSSYNSGTNITTGTILVNTDYTIANETITSASISYELNPAGYPAHFNFTPSYTNVTIGNAVTNKGEIQVGGGFVEGWTHFQFAPTSDTPTSSVTGSIDLTIPVATSTDLPVRTELGGGTIFDNDTGNSYKTISVYIGSSIQMRALNSSATYTTQAIANATVPITWAGGDYFVFYFRYPHS